MYLVCNIYSYIINAEDTTFKPKYESNNQLDQCRSHAIETSWTSASAAASRISSSVIIINRLPIMQSTLYKMKQSLDRQSQTYKYVSMFEIPVESLVL